MPGFDGTGPLGRGPMTGRGRGFCVLRTSEENPGRIQGLTGINNRPIGQTNESFNLFEREVINMPFGNGTGPAGMGPMTGRSAGFCAGYQMPGYMNPVAGRAGFYGAGMLAVRPYGAGYGMPLGDRSNPWLRRGFGFGRGYGRSWGRGRGRGRFGYLWQSYW